MKRAEFSRKTKAQAFQRAQGKCEVCGAALRSGKFRYDHILPDALGGEPTLENCRVQCVTCDRPKTAADVRRIRKADRQRDRDIGAITPKRNIASRGFPKRNRERKDKPPLPARRPMWITLDNPRGTD